MTSTTFEVPNISCNGCVQAIKFELSQLDGVESVSGDAASRRIDIAFDAPATIEAIIAALEDIEYPPLAS